MLDTILPIATLVLLLVWMGFFMLGSLPLLVLKHDVPMDARFIRGFFDVNYKAVMVVASVATLSHAIAGRTITAGMLLGVVLIAWRCSRAILPRMDRLRATMTPTDAAAIREFRRLHMLGMGLNVAQLAVICGTLPIVI